MHEVALDHERVELRSLLIGVVSAQDEGVLNGRALVRHAGTRAVLGVRRGDAGLMER